MSKSRTGFALREVAARGFAVGIVGLGLILGGQSAVFASVGCTALNGSYSGGAVTGATSGTGFSAGDTITLTVTAAGGGDTLGLYDATNFNVLLASTNSVGTRTYTVAANTPANFVISGNRFDALSNFTWSCTAGSSGAGGTDSQKLDWVQKQASTLIAAASSTATASAVSNATDNALNQGVENKSGDGGAGKKSSDAPAADTRQILTKSEYAVLYAGPYVWDWTNELFVKTYTSQGERDYEDKIAAGLVPVRVGNSYGWQAKVLPFAPEQRSIVARGANEAFAALGYAGGMPVKGRGPTFGFTPEWSVWSSVAGSGYSQSDSSAAKGTQINATAGLSYKLSPKAVLGLYAGYENFKYDFDTLAGSLKGNGGSIGTYAGWQLTPTLRWKGMVGWTGLSYDGSAGTASGSFNGSRWLFSTSLNGSYRVAAFVVEPSASVFALTEHQTGYTDSLAVAHDARDFSTGRASFGGKVIAPPQMMLNAWLRPYVGLYGDWGFMSDSAVPADVSSRGLGAGWSARVTTGVSMPVFGRGTLALGGEYGGIGGDYKVWTGNARLSVPF